MKLSQIKNFESGVAQAGRAAMIKAANSNLAPTGEKINLGSGGGSVNRSSAMNYGNYFNGYSPDTYNLQIYRLIRNIIPFIDTAIVKMGLYIGDFTFHSDDEQLQDHLRTWYKRVQVNNFGQGISEWIKQIVESAFTLGMGIGQRTFDDGLFTTNGLYNGNAEYLRFMEQNGGLVLAYQTPAMFRPEAFENQEDMFYLAFDRRDGNPFGYSILSSIPIASQIFTRMNESLHNQVWRLGDPTWFFTIKGDKEHPESNGPKDIYNTIQSGLQDVYKARQRGQVMDLGTYMPGGFDVEVKMLGADGNIEVFDFEFPNRMIIEQLITVFPIPPWSYNLHNWNSNYKMSEDQRGLLQGAIDKYRNQIDIMIDKLVFGEKISQGKPSAKVWWKWSDISLVDAADKAETRKLNAEAQEKEMNNAVLAYQMGQINDLQLLQRLEEIGVVPSDADKDQVLENARSYKKMLLLNQVGRNLFAEKNIESIRGN